MPAPPQPRHRRVNQIQVLKAEGKTTREIAEITGLSYETVRTYMYDPTGESHRQHYEKLRKPCPVCGKPKTPTAARCRACMVAAMHQNRKWTPEAIIDAFHKFAAGMGRPPVFTDTQAYPDMIPNGRLVRREFGSWANAVEAAGFPRPKRGGDNRIKIKPRDGT